VGKAAEGINVRYGDMKHGEEVCRCVRLCVFIYNPKLFKLFMDLARRYGLTFNVPNSVDELVSCNTLLVDEEGVRVLKLSDRSFKHLDPIVVNRNSIVRAVLKLAGVNEPITLLIGIDIGNRIAYAMFANNVMVKHGYVADVKGFEDVVNEMQRTIRPYRTVVKIGYSRNKYIAGKVSELASRLKEVFEADVLIVNEEGTSKGTNFNFLGHLSRDVRAATNIAFKQAFKECNDSERCF